MSHKFYGGVHPAEHKEATEHKPVVLLSKAPSQVVISMSMHAGAPCKPIVKVGDTVTVGQKIGEVAGLGAPIHASVSGLVVAIEPRPHTSGEKVNAVVIENDYKNTPSPDIHPHNVDDLTAQEIIDIVKEAGITGMGGAGFPTHVKLSSAIGKADTLILNGAECEPYITADHRLMLEQGERVIGGTRILMKALGLNTATIGVEGNKMDAIEHLKSLLPPGETGITVETLRTRYPQGAEKQLIQRITGREVPPGGLPADVGCCVCNVGTAAAVYDAVVLGKPVTERILTVTGSAVSRPINVVAPIGTPFSYLIEEAGGFSSPAARVISGGPMMGAAQYDLAVSTVKATNSILCLAGQDLPVQDKEQSCLHCGRCVNVCPMHLTPMYMNMYFSKRKWRDMEDMRVMDCMECGSCQFICPARIPLLQGFRTAKAEIRNLAMKAKEGKA